MVPYPNPDNIPGTDWHEPGEAVAPADLRGWSGEGQGCEGTAAAPPADQKPG